MDILTRKFNPNPLKESYLSYSHFDPTANLSNDNAEFSKAAEISQQMKEGKKD